MTDEQRDFRARFFDVADGDHGFEVPPAMSVRAPKEERARDRAYRRAQEEALATQRMLGIAMVLAAIVGCAVALWGVSRW